MKNPVLLKHGRKIKELYNWFQYLSQKIERKNSQDSLLKESYYLQIIVKIVSSSYKVFLHKIW